MSLGLDRYQYRVSVISRYSSISVGIGIGRYLFEYWCRYQQSCRSFTCLNSQHCCNARLQFQAYTVFSRIYPAYIYNLHTPIPCTKSHFQYKKFVRPSIGICIGTAAAAKIGYRAPARYRSNPKCLI